MKILSQWLEVQYAYLFYHNHGI
uniref:Uncharacterized protein n=1 Tax=Arundo donax TaxID=35708 RepID=A0A0A8YWP6_ARUDO